MSYDGPDPSEQYDDRDDQLWDEYSKACERVKALESEVQRLTALCAAHDVAMATMLPRVFEMAQEGRYEGSLSIWHNKYTTLEEVLKAIEDEKRN